jgi:hypothetical protein
VSTPTEIERTSPPTRAASTQFAKPPRLATKEECSNARGVIPRVAKSLNRQNSPEVQQAYGKLSINISSSHFRLFRMSSITQPRLFWRAEVGMGRVDTTRAHTSLLRPFLYGSGHERSRALNFTATRVKRWKNASQSSRGVRYSRMLECGRKTASISMEAVSLTLAHIG